MTMIQPSFLVIMLLFVAAVVETAGFNTGPTSQGSSLAFITTTPQKFASTDIFIRQRVLNAGFGSDGTQKKKDQKLKPKQQWDRYTDSLKKENAVRVAVKAVQKESKDWLEVGNVKSKGGEYTKAAVARQRALIAEHARRLFPLQVSQKDNIEWAYKDAASDEWVIVDKNVLEGDDIPDGIEKMIGFEGRPDPATGYYCMYNEGRLVNSDEDLQNPLTRPTKKLQ